MGQLERPPAGKGMSSSPHRMGPGLNKMSGQGARDSFSPDSVFLHGTPRIPRNLNSVLVLQGSGRYYLSRLEGSTYFI